MKFEVTYTAEQEDFRKEVQGWIKTHAEGVSGGTVDPKDVSAEQLRRNKSFRKELGKKGWFMPHLPKEMGGGGLSPEHALVLREELSKLSGWRLGGGVGPPTFLPSDISLAVAGYLISLGTGEQKERMLPPILRGEWHIWELFTEPNSGSDLPSLQTTADRDGDEYVLNGTKIFVGGSGDLPDYHCTLAITDRDAPRHRNTSMILVPGDAKGITVHDLDLLATNVKRMITLEDVRVPATQVIGQEGDGWACFSGPRTGEQPFPDTSLLVDDHDTMDEFISYCKETRRNGQPISKDPEVQEILTKAYVENEVQRLLNLRNYWMAEQSWLGTAKKRMTYERQQVVLNRKVMGPRNADAMLKAMGPIALTANNPWSPLNGATEFYHRSTLVGLHPGGTVEINKLRVFRGLIGPGTRISSA